MKNQMFSYYQNEKQICPLSSLLFNIIQEILDKAIKQDIKDMQIGKEDLKPSLLTQDMFIHITNSKKSQKTPKIISNYSEAVAYKLINKSPLLS